MRYETCHGPFGKYKIKKNTPPNESLFRLRIKALLLNEDFRLYCESQDIKDRERKVLGAWGNFQVWAKNFEKDYCRVALLFYGDIFHTDIGFTWPRFKNSVNNVHLSYRPFPFCALSPGTPAPADRLTVTFDPMLSHRDLLRMFQRFLTATKGEAVARPALSGYFEVKPNQKIDEIKRFIEAATEDAALEASCPQARYKHIRFKHMAKLYKNYPGNEKALRRTIYRDIEKGNNISYWALRGLFPKTENIKTSIK